ncbi:hypothetical protein [Actinomadura sp. WMMA1423]|uniref:hypothetical protein n=1 Tax=Actinomadura sp. WMMA1423 TaxID=2591108 RepID=UPI001147395A|nr:hypothetical protein [Actinomadura sp. WMMA1423]
MNTTLIALDIPNFGDPRRTHDVQRLLRATMYAQLEESFAMTRLPWRDCHREDRGDGALIVAPPTVAPYAALDPLAHHLTALLRRSNRLANDITRLRLRMAVHCGEVHHDAHGVLGQDVTHLFRLLDAPAFKLAMADARDADLGMVVSDHLYRAAAAEGALDPDAYAPVSVDCKQAPKAKARLWLPPRR